MRSATTSRSLMSCELRMVSVRENEQPVAMVCNAVVGCCLCGDGRPAPFYSTVEFLNRESRLHVLKIKSRDIAAELRRLGEIDRCDAHPLVSCVNRCERAISVAQCDRSAALQRLAASHDISDEMLRQVLSDDAVSEIMAMRAE